MTRNKSPHAAERIILLCFFLSGFSSLIYEVIWTRMMVLVFGATTLAISTVLTVFMGGLALGSLLFGRTMSRWGHPLLVYAVLELIVGVYGLLIPWILPYLVPLYQVAWEAFNQNFYLFSLARFALAGVVLIVPTILMGATLPVLGRFFSGQQARAGRCLGMLYGLNTLGAVAGTFSTGFVLLPMIGVHQSTLVAALANLGVAAASMIAWKTTTTPMPMGVTAPSQVMPAQAPASVSSSLPEMFTPGKANLVLAAFSLSGFSAMVYEVTWSRTLSLILGSTIYAFSAMLTTFLVGLSLGSLAMAFMVDRIRNPLKVFGILQLLVALSSYLTLLLLREMPHLFVTIYSQWLPSATWIPMVWFAISFLAMFMPTLFLGALFPIVIRLTERKFGEMGRLAGDVYAMNTVGAILGSFSAGFVLVPLIGIQAAMMSAVTLNMILGLLVIMMRIRPFRIDASSARRWVTIGGGVVLILALLLLQPHWDARLMSSGVFMNLPQKAELLQGKGRQQFYEELGKGREIVYYKEGMTATITVEQDPDTGISLRVNGRREAGTQFLRTQAILGHLPMMLRSGNQMSTENVLIIGWGSGATAGAVAQHPVQQITAVELEPAILDANRFFEELNRGAMRNPRVETVVNDGRNYLLIARQKFDVIISQPSLPWITGASNLFTEEFFRLGASRLKEGGIFCQWLSSDVIALEDLQSVLQAFRSSFASVMVFQAVPGDLILLGSSEPLNFLRTIETAFQNQDVASDLARADIRGIWDLVALYLFQDEELDAFIDGMISNTDDNAVVETLGPIHYYMQVAQQNKYLIASRLAQFHTQEVLKGRHPIARQASVDPQAGFMNLARVFMDTVPLRALLYVNASLQQRETAEAYYAKGKILSDSMSDHPAQQGEYAQEAIQSYERALALGLPDSLKIQAHFEVGSALWKAGQGDQARFHYEKVLEKNPESFEAHSNLGGIHLQAGHLNEALAAYQKAAQINPSDPQAYFKMGLIFSRLKKFNTAISSYQEAIKLFPEYVDAHYNLALAYELTRHQDEALKHYRYFLKLVPDTQEYKTRQKLVEAKVQLLSAPPILKR